jgi:hypothetical protein
MGFYPAYNLASLFSVKFLITFSGVFQLTGFTAKVVEVVTWWFISISIRLKKTLVTCFSTYRFYSKSCWSCDLMRQADDVPLANHDPAGVLAGVGCRDLVNDLKWRNKYSWTFFSHFPLKTEYLNLSLFVPSSTSIFNFTICGQFVNYCIQSFNFKLYHNCSQNSHALK